MTWYLGGAVLTIFFIILLKRVIKPNRVKQKRHQRLIKAITSEDFSPTANQRLVAFLHKGINKLCLSEDGKIYGVSFKNKQPSELPHVAGCRCEYQIEPMRISNIFSAKKSKAETYKTDLGDLDFYSYKYYKYSLMMLSDEDKEKRKTIEDLRSSLIMDASFVDKVKQHLME
ncbi:MAG: hypothetical protein JJV97_02510 [SAR324 cluster bacterium]|nr:hypothetical protein [SAR324 cluster bacterium]